MAWVNPRTYTVGEVLTAGKKNEDRDNFKWIGGIDGRGTALPSSPLDGQLFVYVADDAGEIEWLLKYKSATSKWRKIGGPPLTAEVITGQTTTSTSFADLATVGPSVTVPLAGKYNIESYCGLQNATTGAVAAASPRLGGTVPSEDDGSQYNQADADKTVSCAAVALGKTLAALDVVKLQYKVSTSTGTFWRRKIVVDPIYVNA